MSTIIDRVTLALETVSLEEMFNGIKPAGYCLLCIGFYTLILYKTATIRVTWEKTFNIPPHLYQPPPPNYNLSSNMAYRAAQ